MKIPALLKALRPHQWTKNLAIFVGVLFGWKRIDPDMLTPVLGLFVAFCLISSCIYLVNDILDREEDARHPTKRHRPIASGQIPVGAAWLLAAALCAVAIGLSFWLPRPAGSHPWLSPAPLSVFAYLAVNASYNLGLKKVAIADVTCVALGFLIRVVSGPAVGGLEVSSWLVLCTFFGSLFLALAKRRSEMFATEGGGGRSVLNQYHAQGLDQLVAMAATCTLLCYSIYTVAPETVEEHGTRNLFYSVPPVFFGLGRYLLLVYRKGTGEDPASTLFTDPGMLCAIVLWLAVSAAALFA